jgi:hypothetical protein
VSNGAETSQKLESRPRRDSVIAWVAGVLSLIALPVGNAVAGIYLESRGYDIAAHAPADIEMVGWVWFAAVDLVPALIAGWFGLRAYRAGERSARIPALLAAVVAGMVVVVGLLNLRNLLFG